jgi:hypothetical protein
MDKIQLLRSSIVCSAKKYVGQKEVSGNKDFVDAHFKRKMIDRGWESGQAWCSYAAEQFWYEGYTKSNYQIASKVADLFSANAVRTYNNLAANGFEGSLEPEPGDLAVWQSYWAGKPRKNGIWYLGHIGVVIDVTDNGFTSVEGNSNQSGGREGIEVAKKERTFDFDVKQGLRLIGFIKPKYLKS